MMLRLLLLIIALLASVVAFAQSDNQSPKQFEVLPSAPAQPASAPLRLHGALRERATYIDNGEFNAASEDQGWFWTQRLSMSADFKAHRQVEGRVTLLSALQEGFADSPVERNDLDLQEAYVDWLPNAGQRLRLGRQELALGSQRLIGTRAGTNVKRNWDGARYTHSSARSRFDLFALREVRVTSSGAFNDDSHDGARLYGLYSTLGDGSRASQWDLYYLRSEIDRRRTVAGVADQTRHTVGVRAFGERGGLFWNWEGFYQRGRHGEDRIAAWSVAANTGYRFSSRPWQPEYLFSVNVASGDRRANDGRLETFDALFARGSYFSELALLAPSNFFNLHHYLRLAPSPRLALFVDVNLYWRARLADGVYANPTRLLIGPDEGEGRFVNASVSAGLEWEASEHMFFSMLYTRAQPQRFLKSAGADAPISFLELTARLSF